MSDIRTPDNTFAEEPQEPFAISENKRIAKKISDLLGQPSSPDKAFSQTMYRSPGDRKNTYYHFGAAYTPKSREEDGVPFKLAPEGLSYPFYTFYSVTYDPEIYMTTPYGAIPQFVVGADKNLYKMKAWYFFDESGNAKKYEEVENQSKFNTNLNRLIESSGQSQQTIKTLDFTPDEGDSRYVDLTSGDYEVIANTLYLIEKGEYPRMF